MKIKEITLSLCFLLITLDLYAQCAMCKAVVESNLESGNSIGSGLNDGILYLMSIPYLAILFFGIFWYYQNKRIKQ
ncbi:MAG: hypothetical protein VX347_00875 [Bacteroidota bacterium]|nr:hypothetical protein [Bacteroidota bacterium]